MIAQATKSRMPAAKRRELIVEAALEEFAQLGYEAASIGRIATAAGVSRTVLYDHFPSKLELFKQLLHTEQQALISYLSAAFDSPGTTEDRWRAAFDAFFRFVEEQPLAWRLLYPRRPPLDDDAAHEYRRQRDESNRILADLLAADARRAGLEPRTVRARAVFAMHRDALIAVARWWATHPEVAREEIVGAAMAALWTGFGGLQPPG
jgi:AcrR family transcriptional regulator